MITTRTTATHGYHALTPSEHHQPASVSTTLYSTTPSSRLSFRTRLTSLIIALVLAAVLAASSLVYVQYRHSYTQTTIEQLQNTGEMMSGSFHQWLDARQDEIRYIAGLESVRQHDTQQMDHLLAQLAAQNGFYDTIFFVGSDGRGVSGVSYDHRLHDHGVSPLSPAEASEFHVADRAWFQQAIQGELVFSQPLVSRATGNQVSNVVAPVFNDAGDVTGVVRAAVRLDVLFERMASMSLGDSSDTYLLASDGTPVTPVAALGGQGTTVATQAAEALGQGQSGVGQYRDAGGTEVMGSYTYLPRLDWGLVVEVAKSEALADVHRVFWLLIAMTSGILIITILCSLWLVRSVVNTLGGDPHIASHVVRRVVDGDLTTPVPVIEGDTTSLIAHIAEMQRNLRQMMVDIQSAAEAVNTASNEIAQGNDDLANRTEEQSSSLVETASSIEQMSATVRQTADSAHQAHNISQSLNVQAHTASDVGMQATLAMSAIKQANQQVVTIVEAIDSIAFQTNLLALNASVEAARAGEHGRGFAVVADEVRKLARRSAEEASQIREVVNNSAVKVDEGESLVNNAGQQLLDITHGVQRVTALVSEISTATTEQSHGIDQINQAVSQLDEVTQQNAALVEQASAASQSLNEQAHELSGLLSRFQVSA